MSAGSAGRTWWTSFEGDGQESSFKTIREVIEAKGPFDGVLGFSQGGMIAASYLAAHREFSDALKFGIFVASRVPPKFTTKSKMNLASLHVMGKSDSHITVTQSEELASSFSSPQLLVHDGGCVYILSLQSSLNLIISFGSHLIPQDAVNRKTIADFIQQFSK